jgi:hypothetical protein
MMPTHVPLASYGRTLLIVSWVEAAIASILLLARVYTTWRIIRHIRSDLYLALLTFVWHHHPLITSLGCSDYVGPRY